MSTGDLWIDLGAVVANWRALDAQSGAGTATAAVIKADAYGLGTTKVAPALAHAGVRDFFVATCPEGAIAREALGPGPRIFVFSGHMGESSALITSADLIPLINDAAQFERHMARTPDAAFGVQIDSGMARLGVPPEHWPALRERMADKAPALIMSHLACADEPDHSMNAQQLANFTAMTEGMSAPRSLAATGGTLLGAEYHFDLVRPGVGLYGGLPFEAARAVVELTLPIIQTRALKAGASVGYGNAWIAPRDSVIATLAGGYADGILRSLSAGMALWHEGQRVPIVGRVSMDMLTVDVTDLQEVPAHLTLLGANQGVDDLAAQAGTIGYEILTSLGTRYARHWKGAA